MSSGATCRKTVGHGQDHLMDGMVVYDLASEIIEILRERKL